MGCNKHPIADNAIGVKNGKFDWRVRICSVYGCHRKATTFMSGTLEGGGVRGFYYATTGRPVRKKDIKNAKCGIYVDSKADLPYKIKKLKMKIRRLERKLAELQK